MLKVSIITELIMLYILWKVLIVLIMYIWMVIGFSCFFKYTELLDARSAVAGI